ncbi:MAG: PIG-L family deacetylase [Bryobacterales bacterium]|nr:PIG-L family deacetylase [Bryobacterales bacterium]
MKKRILAIHAHPDDVEILAGGTLALLSAGGHDLTIVTMTPGDCGSAHHSPEEIAAIRRSEAAAAATRIGARYLCAEFRDLSIFSDEPSRRRIVELLRRTRPEIVLTSAPVDYMADHEATSMLVRDACFAAPAANYNTHDLEPAAALPAIPHLYFMDPIGGVDRDERPIQADFYVDISSRMAVKKQMLAEHRSQRDWLLHHHGMDDYIDQMERWSASIGKRAGVTAAEGFRQYRGHPYPPSPLLQELLSGYVHCRAA